ncbi:MAG: CRTAC1 family protein [Bryobacteraceae bacterium]|nr:CRTAC1 family protein [Bryobacteraceae bacterium]
MGRFSRRAFLTSAVLALNANASGPGPLFEEVPATSSGISWKHDNATSAQHYMPEAIGPGCAFLDYDNDGWMDIFLVNSGPSAFWNPKTPVRNALYKNNRDGTFTDVTLKAGIAGNFFGMGAAVGDYDNDGWPDLLVTGYERVALYKNNHNGTFSDVTAKAGLAKLPSNWPTSAVWFDYDNDGRLDLFLCNYIEYPPGSFKQCGDNRIGRNYYCVPRVFNGAASMLFRNNGDGTFTCTSAGTSIEKAKGKALGVVATDVNNDGRMDLFVANDTVANFLFLNRGSGKDGKWNWEETGLASEVGYGENGQARSGMGADSADFDQDGLMDLFVSNIDQEMYSMYRNNGDETFTDVAHQYGIAQSTRTLSGWGLKFFDYDNDGDLDLILANAHPDDMIEMYSEQIKYKMPALLFHQENGKLRNVSSEAGPAFAKPLSSRGLAIGDFNNDGRPDVLIACNGAAPVLLKNNSGAGNHWLGVHLRGTSCNADAIGTRIIWQVGTRKRSRLKTGGGSYLSSHDPREILGLGSSATVDSLEIKWAPPSTRVDRFSAIPADRYIRIEEGRGIIRS